MESMGIDPNFWKNKRVFLTGHTGFKGSWLALWLQKLEVNLTGYALPPPTKPSLFDVAQVSRNMNSIIGDVRDLAHLKNVLETFQPEIVIHMAAQSLVRYSYNNPVETYSTNVMGTVHLLEAVRHIDSVKAIVNVTSDKCYENNEWVWGYRENEPMGGFDPYSNSKGCAELVTSAYRSSFFNPEHYSQHGVALASARAGNVIGGGDWATDRLIPDILKSIIADEPVRLRNPYATRPWQHVLEPLNGYLTLSQALYKNGIKFAEAWNFGPKDQDVLTVENVTRQIVTNWGGNARYEIISQPNTLHEATLLKLDCSKAYNHLKWQPKWDAKKTIEKICRWHKAHQDMQNMQNYCLQEIKEFDETL
jgi:CDP-glucose 4,6-dehydratase